MKTLPVSLPFVALLAAVFFAPAALADCTTGDTGSAAALGLTLIGNFPAGVGNSFTAPCTGFLRSVTVSFGTGGGSDFTVTNGTLQIYDGTSLTAPTLLHTETGVSGAGITTITLTAPVAVTMGSTYTFVVAGGAGQQIEARAFNADVYAGGQALSQSSLWSPGADLYFGVSILSTLPQTITGLAASPSTGTVGGTSTLSVTGSGASGNAVVYASSTPAVCTVAGNIVTYLTAGTCTVTANQAGNATYDAAPQVSLNITAASAVPALSDAALLALAIGLGLLAVLPRVCRPRDR